LHEIEKIEITTHESAIRIIDKKGPLTNPADRDHCLQYMTAIGLIYGTLTADHYEDEIAKDPLIDALREKMICIENKQYSKDYLDPEKRSIANAVQVFFKDGSMSEKIEVEYPLGHKRRRSEGMPLLKEKFENNLGALFDQQIKTQIADIFNETEKFDLMPVKVFIELFLLK
jgi:2-methylcitrate dehydratase PrpD